MKHLQIRYYGAKVLCMWLQVLFGISVSGNLQAQFACAGVDHVDIYINNKLAATANLANAPVLKIDTSVAADTIILHSYANWEGLRNSTLDINDQDGELMEHVNSYNNTGYEAVFTYIFRPRDYSAEELQNFDIDLNLLCEKIVETDHVAHFKLGR